MVRFRYFSFTGASITSVTDTPDDETLGPCAGLADARRQKRLGTRSRWFRSKITTPRCQIVTCLRNLSHLLWCPLEHVGDSETVIP